MPQVGDQDLLIAVGGHAHDLEGEKHQQEGNQERHEDIEDIGVLFNKALFAKRRRGIGRLFDGALEKVLELFAQRL